MYLKELIAFLEKQNPAQVVPVGFHRPHSYRGYYDQLAFEPKRSVTIGSMLKCAQQAIGQTFEGYKGGDYTMGEHTDVYLAEYGSTGEQIGQILLAYMVRDLDSLEIE